MGLDHSHSAPTAIGVEKCIEHGTIICAMATGLYDDGTLKTEILV
jgi:hypothetical protein